jgi:hypothetical protein
MESLICSCLALLLPVGHCSMIPFVGVMVVLWLPAVCMFYALLGKIASQFTEVLGNYKHCCNQAMS